MSDETKNASGPHQTSDGSQTFALNPENLRETLRMVLDPDLRMSIVDLGLVYGIDVLPNNRVHVRMTLTSRHCPYGPALVGEVKSVLESLPGVAGVDITLVWDPPWSWERLSEEARFALGLEL